MAPGRFEKGARTGDPQRLDWPGAGGGSPGRHPAPPKRNQGCHAGGLLLEYNHHVLQ